MNKFKILFIITNVFLLTSCAKEEQLTPETSAIQENSANPNTGDSTAQEAVMLGDWVHSSNTSAQTTVYRFQADGSVLIGRSGTNRGQFSNGPYYDNTYGSPSNDLKFHFKSSWTIKNNILQITGIQGGRFSRNTSIDTGATTISFHARFIAENYQYVPFEKDINNTYNFNNEYDLTQAQINLSSFNGKWIEPYSSEVQEINNGQVVGLFLYDDNTGVITPTPLQGTASFLFLNPDFPGQILGRKVNIYTNSIISGPITYNKHINDFTVDQNGVLIYLELKDHTNSVVYEDYTRFIE